jgi:hypothetical protein
LLIRRHLPAGWYVAAGDINGDMHADIITGAGRNGGGNVKVFDGLTTNLLANFFAFDPSYPGGITVGSSRVNTDLVPDIIVGAVPDTPPSMPGSEPEGNVGTGPVVEVFDGTNFSLIRNFFAYDPSFTAWSVCCRFKSWYSEGQPRRRRRLRPVPMFRRCFQTSRGNPSGVPVTIPINTTDVTGRGIIAVDITFNFSPSVLSAAPVIFRSPPERSARVPP